MPAGVSVIPPGVCFFPARATLFGWHGRLPPTEARGIPAVMSLRPARTLVLPADVSVAPFIVRVVPACAPATLIQTSKAQDGVRSIHAGMYVARGGGMFIRERTTAVPGGFNSIPTSVRRPPTRVRRTPTTVS